MSDETSGARGHASPLQAPNWSVDAKGAPDQAPPSLQMMNTLMAADRTLMAWIRTSLSLLSFGFTIYKILQAFHDAGEKFIVRPEVPRDAGLFLTGMGTLAMVLGTIEYWQTLKVLHQPRIFGRPRMPLVMAVIMSLTGMVLFFSITAKVL